MLFYFFAAHLNYQLGPLHLRRQSVSRYESGREQANFRSPDRRVEVIFSSPHQGVSIISIKIYDNQGGHIVYGFHFNPRTGQLEEHECFGLECTSTSVNGLLAKTTELYRQIIA